MTFHEMKLGRVPSRKDKRTLLAAKYMESVQPPPASVDYGAAVKKWPMSLNDKIGDCTAAAAGHQIEAWTANALGKTATLSNPTVLKLYEATSGYDPSDPSTDQGAMPIDVLNYWRKHPLTKHRIDAFAAVSPGNRSHVQQSIWIFGGIYIGLDMPITAQSQTVWDVVNVNTKDGKPGSWGGHAVNVVAYDAEGCTVVTWGQTLKMTWAFWNAYCSEAWAIISPDWMKAGKTPGGFDLTALNADLAALGQVA